MTSAPPLVLVVDDEASLRRFLRAALLSHGYRPVEANSVRTARRLAAARKPDLFLLDLGLPDGDGLDLIRWVRGWSEAPVIVLDGRVRSGDEVTALDAGADDYLAKPFGMGELLARMRAAFRHAAGALAPDAQVQVGPLRIEVAERRVSVRGREVDLTRTEFRLLAFLARRAGQVVTLAQLLREVRGPAATEVHQVRVHVAELRRKLEADPARPALLVTEPGVGYRLRDRGAWGSGPTR